MDDVVHILDAACDGEAVLEASLLAGEGARLLSLGPPPAMEGWRGRRPIKAVSLSDLYGPGRALSTGEAVACCWSLRAAARMAEEALEGPAALVARLTSAPPERDLHELACGLASGQRLAVACATGAIADAVRGSAVPAEIVTIPPLVGPGGEDPGAVRERLGIAADETVVAAPGAPAEGGRLRLAVWAVAILTEAAFKVRLLIEAAGPGCRDVERFARDAGFGPQVTAVGADTCLAEMLAASDLALLGGADGLPPVSTAAVLAAGLPVVVADVAAADDWFAADAAVRVEPDKPRAIAQGLMTLIEDKDLARRLAGASRARAADSLDPARIRGEWAGLYAAMARSSAESAG